MSAPTIQKTTVRGCVRWCLDNTVNGRRARKFFFTKAEGDKELAELLRQRAAFGESWSMMPPAKRIDLMSVDAEVVAAGLTLREVWEGYRAGRNGTAAASIGLARAVREVVESKRAQGLRVVSVRALESYLNAFAKGRGDIPVSHLGPRDIEMWFGGRDESPSTRQSNLGRLSSLFDFCWRSGYITENPCHKVARVRIDQAAPTVLTLAQCEAAMGFIVAELPAIGAWLTLALFAGIRPEECDRLKWADIDTERGTVRIDAAASKVRQRRIVHLMPAAVAWIAWAKKKKARLGMPKITRRRMMRKLRDHLKLVEWPADVLRHTCASNWLAEWQDAGKVAHELGNSPGILLRHYREIVTREDAKRFWAIQPPSFNTARMARKISS